MIRFIAVLFGIALIFAGVAGFIPALTVNGALLGIFEVDMLHNIVHIVTGVLAIMAATTLRTTKLFFLIFGIVYTVIAILGFVNNGNLFLMHVNMADNFLHLGIGLFSMYLAYYINKQLPQP
jgi:hypothetical protein